MRILMLGDVVGRPGRRVVREMLRPLREELGIDFVVANGENAAGGTGITTKTFNDLTGSGVDVITTGNHVYRQRDVLNIFNSDEDRLLRPANFSGRPAGRGTVIREDRAGRRVGVINLQSRVFMGPSEDPFEAADRLVTELTPECDVILVDLHGEATSEKEAMGYFLEGRVAAMAGTHTHVPTADACVLPGGTAYITDLGMCGPHDSCLGVTKEIVIRKFVTGMPARFTVASGDVRMQGLLFDVDPATGLATSAERLERRLPE
ncbi:MAG: TIGR00282 family metallophosphoesterase [Planctomycetota bacterium]